MNLPDIDILIASRLEDIAERVWELHAAGNLRDAELLRDEGLLLASSYDEGSTFLYISDLKQV